MAGRALKDQSDDDIVREAHTRFKRCQDWESKARQNALYDTRFANGDAYNMYQWPDRIQSTRGDRPTLTFNKTRQHNLHIVNDSRQHKAQIKVTPTGGGATYEAAEIYSAIVRRIEYQSKAIDAYSTAIYHQVESGIGYVRVVTDYADDDSFDQEIYIRRVPDPRTVYLDPDAKDYDKADMKFAFVFTDTDRKDFDAAHPDEQGTSDTFDSNDSWDSRDRVRQSEYWRRGEKTHTLHRLRSGQTVHDSKLQSGEKAMLDVVDSRDVVMAQIEWFRISGHKIVERKAWPGRYIPIVPFIGEETVIDGVMDRRGHTRCLLDAQRMYNYWNSIAAEQVALQSKSPYLADPRAISGYEAYWDTANTANHPYLPYNSIDENGSPVDRPERAQAPIMASAYVQGMNIAKEDMMLVSGQYQAEMGAPGNEKSGVAIQQRQREGETATYHYIDNQAKGIRQIGRIIVDLIPHILDVARVIKIMAADGTQTDVHLDPTAKEAHQHVMPGGMGQPDQPITTEQAKAAENDPDMPDPHVIFNPAVGRYDVEADVGPSFGTQREEAYNALSQIMQTNPDLMKVAGDLLFRSADFPLASEMADRLKRGVPPQFLGGPSPQVAQLQQQLQHTSQAAHSLTNEADAEIASLKQQIQSLQAAQQDKAAEMAARVERENYRDETDRMKVVGGIDPDAMKPVLRSLISEALQTPIVPLMAHHAAAEQAMQPSGTGQ